MLVVKVGGAEGVDLGTVCADMAALAAEGQPWVLVHGGSHETNQVAEKLGHPPEFVTSVSGYTSRKTDRRTIEIFEMVYCGKRNKALVERLQALGVNAVGLSGLDGRLLEGPRKKALKVVHPETGKRLVLRDTYTGTVKKVNASLLRLLLDAGYWPVLTPPAISEEHEAINVDGDRAAARVAAALGAETLVILSDVPGVLRDFPREESLVERLPRHRIEEAQERWAQGRMRIKLLGAKEALEGGVARVILGDSRGESPVRAALSGKGTVIE
ncbi:MAG: [LysW]-aminoadipate kinase [Planctomycetota bacterium]|nr:MAG: [LysW]-aminoadipate kinase [Planctomycetota bacterium]